MSESELETVAEKVDFILKMAKLPVTAEERAGIIQTYPALAEMAAQLRLPEVRYFAPAITYLAPIRAS